MEIETSLRHWDFARGTASSLLMIVFGEEAGVRSSTLLAGTGLTVEQLRDPHREVAARQELTVVENLLAALGDPPALGLAVGARYRIGTFGIFGYACITSPTLRDAIEFGMRFYELSFGFCLPTAELTPTSVTLTLDDPALPLPASRFLLERDLASIYTWLTDLVGPVPLDEVTFPFEDRGGDQSLFGVPARFGQPTTSASFSAAVLDQPLPQANEVTVAAAQESCRSLVTARRRRTGIAHDVRELLVTVDGPAPSIEEVAVDLAMSERTLRRRLDDAGTSYRSLLGEVRQTLAEQMLATGALSVEDVAIRLGYAEATPFIAAFKRWTGVTPARWQRSR